jgi:hypothetical protein
MFSPQAARYRLHAACRVKPVALDIYAVLNNYCADYHTVGPTTVQVTAVQITAVPVPIPGCSVVVVPHITELQPLRHAATCCGQSSRSVAVQLGDLRERGLAASARRWPPTLARLDFAKSLS